MCTHVPWLWKHIQFCTRILRCMCKNTQLQLCTYTCDVRIRICTTHVCKWTVLWRCVLVPSHINVTTESCSKLHPSSSKFSPFLSNKVEKLEHSLPDLLLGKPSQGSFSGFSWLGLMQNEATCLCSQPENHELEGVWGSAYNNFQAG